MIENVCVLCRGKSLFHLDLLPDDAQYVIVNRFGNELLDENISNKLKDKDIHHVLSLSREESQKMIENGDYKTYNINKIVLPYLLETVPGTPSPTEGRNGIIDVQVLSDKCKDYMYKRGERPDGDTRYAYSAPTAGMEAILYSALDLNAKNVYIIGMDFYDVGYAYDREFVSEEEAMRRGEDPNMMKDYLTKYILERFEDKNFFIYTRGNFSSELKNVKVINFND